MIMKHNIKYVMSLVFMFLFAKSTWADPTVTIIKKLNGSPAATTSPGDVTSAISSGTCTLTVTPVQGNYVIKDLITVYSVVTGNVAQAPRRTPTLDSTPIEVTAKDANADPSGETQYTFTMPEDGSDVEVTVDFNTRISISNATITLAETSVTYDGTAKEPAVSSVVLGETTLTTSDYEVSYSNNTNVSADASPTVTVTGKGKYTGEATTTFTITAKTITSGMITLSPTSFVYSGEVQTPEVTVVDLINNEDYQLGENDYEISYQKLNGETATETVETREVGTYNVVVTGKGNYTGSATKSFEITKVPLTLTITVNSNGWTYGDDITETEAFEVAGNAGNGELSFLYKVRGADDNTYTNTLPENAGDYTVKIEVAETENYASGSAIADFTISPASIANYTVSVDATQTYTYTGNAIEPSVTVNDPNGNLLEDENYTVSYENNVNAADENATNKPTAIVTGTGNYTGTASASYTIAQADLADVTIAAIADQEYTGNAIEPEVSVTLNGVDIDDSEYTVSYSDNTDAGEATVTLTSTNNNFSTENTKSATFTILNRTLAVENVTFNNHWATYYSNDGAYDLPAGIGAFVATGVGDGVVTISQIKNIPEGVAVLLNNETTATTDHTIVTGNMLQHAAEEVNTNTTDAVFYGLYNGTMMRVTGTIPAGRNYLYMPLAMNNQGAPELKIVIEGETTGVGASLVNSEKRIVNSDIYDLQGRRVHKPSKKGLYINQGHKVVVK